MKKVCKNCENFVQVSFFTDSHAWGDCMKSARSVSREGKKSGGTFMWADMTCADFVSNHNAKQIFAPDANSSYKQTRGPSELDQSQLSES
jgi:hypothetical protein